MCPQRRPGAGPDHHPWPGTFPGRCIRSPMVSRCQFPLPAILLAILLTRLLFQPVTVAQATTTPAGGRQWRTVRVGYYENPPKMFNLFSGQPQGIFPEILAEIARREKWRLKWVPGTWEEGLERLQAGDIDLMPDVAYSLDRASRYEFSDEPVLLNWGVLYSRIGLDIRSMLDLEGRRVAVMRSSIHTNGREGIINQVWRFNLHCRFIPFDSYEEVFLALQNGAADVGVVNRLFGLSAGRLYDVQRTPVVFNPRYLKFAFPRGGPQTPYLKKTIDRYLLASRRQPDSHIRQIIASYLQERTPKDVAGPGAPVVHLTAREKAWIRRHPRIRVGIDPEFAPFEFIDNNGNYAGFASDYLRILNKRLGLDLEVVDHRSWKDVMARTRKKEIDVLAAVGFTAERTRFLSFTAPYAGFYRMIFCRADLPFISGVEDLRGLRVAVQAGSSHAGWIRENTTLKPIYYDTLEETIRAVDRKKADAFIGNLAASTYWIRRMHITSIRVAAPVSLQRQMLHMAVRKDWPMLVRILDKGLASITPQEAEEIRNRWIAAGYSVGLSNRTVWLRIGGISLLALLAIAMFWYWNRRLQAEISRRTSAEQALLHSKQRLAEQVEERTRELVEANAALRQEMAAKEELLARLHRLEKMEALGLMAGGVAHDLNNILAGVVSYPDLLLMDLPADSPLRRPLEVIRASGERAAAVVADLLTVARGAVLEKKPVDLDTLVRDFLASPEYGKVKSRYPAIEVRVKAAPDLDNILCSPVHVRKVLMNLLMNSFEAMSGEGRVTITTENRYLEGGEGEDAPGPGKWVCLRVADTGPGIAEEDRKRIFEPFYSTKVMGISGTGLGLAIVWNTMQDHGGTVTVRSSEQGTEFLLFFPVTEQEEERSPDDVDEAGPQGRGESVLVVDDEPGQREIASAMLDSLGYRVETAASGQEALARLHGRNFDLVLLDMVMAPGMSGLETFRKMLRMVPGQKAVIVSGFAEHADIEAALRLGAADFVRKPYTLSRLGQAVRGALGPERRPGAS